MYCTQCGKPLPSSGICPRCNKHETLSSVHPLGRTVYAFSESAPFLLICLVWTLSTVWTAVLLFFSSPLAVIATLPCLLFCIGMWMTYGCSLPRQKRSGLSLASGSLLAVITLLAVFMALLCLTGLYGIFLSTTDRESYNTLFSYFKLVGILFVLLFLGVLFLNQLRHVLRTSHGVLRGNRGMAECPLRIGVCSILFGFLSLYLAFAIEKRAVALALIEHALNRLPSGLATLAQPLAEADWVWLGPSFIGGAIALIATGVVLIMYWQVLRLARSEILRKGGQGKKKVDVKAYTKAQEEAKELPEETPEEVR